eukprot:TRINITY_DN840_c0_g1_i2.p1 TRINITY_DN840_c0_g1~~TRINITY_DN840_c0_g1_i2.p1  ORF type:complete len:215 (+),score=49.71 TRINITY_DN840_c0_g1_i2:85-645(+)
MSKMLFPSSGRRKSSESRPRPTRMLSHFRKKRELKERKEREEREKHREQGEQGVAVGEGNVAEHQKLEERKGQKLKDYQSGPRANQKVQRKKMLRPGNGRAKPPAHEAKRIPVSKPAPVPSRCTKCSATPDGVFYQCLDCSFNSPYILCEECEGVPASTAAHFEGRHVFMKKRCAPLSVSSSESES